MTGEEFMIEVKRAFAAELASGSLHLVGYRYSEEAFGNAVAILDAADFRLRIVQDRSELFAEVAHPAYPEEWFWLQLTIRAFAGQQEVAHNYEINVEAAAALLRANRDLLKRGFTRGWWRLKRARLRRLRDANTTRIVEWLKSPEGKRQMAERQAAMDRELANPSPELVEVLQQLKPRD